MSTNRHTLFYLGIAVSFCAASVTQAQDATKLETEIDKASYAIGFTYGKGMKRDLSELELEKIMNGFKDGFEGNDSVLSEEETTQVMTAYQQKKRAEMAEKQNKQASENLNKGQKFLADNAKKEGIKTTKSGLQYKVLKEGEGQPPGPRDVVKVHYEGTLINGSVFDSSRKRGQPIEFSVDGVISGWTEALQLMKPGDHWQLFIPSNLAYGERGTQGPIGPNETLIFDVELLEVSQRESNEG